MERKKIFVAGHAGLVGTAVCTALQERADDYTILTRRRNEVNLENSAETRAFLEAETPDVVVLCAAKVGGIHANSTYPVEFLQQNLHIQLNVMEAAYAAGVQRFIFLGSSCIYPRDCPQPIKEDYLLTGPLEPTNRPYALAKIAGIESCWSYNRQFGAKYLALMPTNMYGPADNYHPENSHVLPALLQRVHDAKMKGAEAVTVWGSGRPKREFMYSLDLGRAIKFFIDMPDEDFALLVHPDVCPLINVGTGEDLSIAELACLIKETVGFTGELLFDTSKPDGTPRKLLDVGKINALGWNSSIQLAEGLKTVYEDLHSNNIDLK